MNVFKPILHCIYQYFVLYIISWVPLHIQAYEYWLRDMYLNYREPIPINSNPGMVMPPRKFTTILDVARFTARLIDAALQHKDILNHRALPMERATSRDPGQPLCMAQYYRILGACRIPGKVRDTQHIAQLPRNGEQCAEHVIVICRSQLYCVPVQAGTLLKQLMGFFFI